MKTLFVLISFLSINAFADYRGGQGPDLDAILKDATIQKIFDEKQGNQIHEVVFVQGRSYNVISTFCTANVEVTTECRSTVPRHNELDICEDKVQIKTLMCNYAN